jgi:tRNA-uridine 2-sulfurtransferase
MPEVNQNRVVVGMSGGVDSSVAASLLIEKGYDVIGVMLRLWQQEGSPCENRCCSTESMTQARRVAAQLGIPFYVLDARDIFRNKVVQAFIDGYKKGLTPNPCFVCNQSFRWNFLLDQARSMGAGCVATGHYARLVPASNGNVELWCGSDYSKDQSYILSGLSQDILQHALLPLGEMVKSAVRQKARGINLPVAERPDSQDLCFTGGQDYRQFLASVAPDSLQPGPVTDRQGQLLGHHAGLALFTIGQRKGLGVPSLAPLYVIEKDLINNRLVVGPFNELGQDTLSVVSMNWISGSPPSSPVHAQVKIRYKADFSPAEVIPEGENRVRVRFQKPLRDITPGQIAVIYLDQVCLGGGIIQP